MATVRTFWKKLKNFAADNIYPAKYCCLLCDLEIFDGNYLCADCFKDLVLYDGATCPKCGRKTAKNEICIECKENRPAYDRAFSPLLYEKNSAKLVSGFKSENPHYATYLAELMVYEIKDIPRADGIVFVPMTKRTRRIRGYNQAKLLAEAFSEIVGLPVLYDVVQKIKDTPAQKDLPREKRLKNLIGCFSADEEAVKGKTLILLDDIMTTGATADCVAKTLKTAGAYAVYVITAASVDYEK